MNPVAKTSGMAENSRGLRIEVGHGLGHGHHETQLMDDAGRQAVLHGSSLGGTGRGRPMIAPGDGAGATRRTSPGPRRGVRGKTLCWPGGPEACNAVDVAQLVELLVVVQAVVGSNPIVHPSGAGIERVWRNR